jgi:hypothetical protein
MDNYTIMDYLANLSMWKALYPSQGDAALSYPIMETTRWYYVYTLHNSHTPRKVVLNKYNF